MPAGRPDIFALQNSGLGAFLYADVGPDKNDSSVTILSMLARLGKDPWAEAARWAELPTAAVIDDLSQCMVRMPLVPAVIAGSRQSAEQLVKLLPGKAEPAVQMQSAGIRSAMSEPLNWLVLGVWIAMALFQGPRPGKSTEATVQAPKEIVRPDATRAAPAPGAVTTATPAAPLHQ